MDEMEEEDRKSRFIKGNGWGEVWKKRGEEGGDHFSQEMEMEGKIKEEWLED